MAQGRDIPPRSPDVKIEASDPNDENSNIDRFDECKFNIVL